jgi:hypothetical protein
LQKSSGIKPDAHFYKLFSKLVEVYTDICTSASIVGNGGNNDQQQMLVQSFGSSGSSGEANAGNKTDVPLTVAKAYEILAHVLRAITTLSSIENFEDIESYLRINNIVRCIMEILTSTEKTSNATHM